MGGWEFDKYTMEKKAALVFGLQYNSNMLTLF